MEEDEIKIEYFESLESDPLCEKQDEIHDLSLIDTSADDCLLNEPVPEDDFLLETELPPIQETWHRQTEGTDKYVCRFCDRSYLTVQTLRHHVKIKHPVHATILKEKVVKNKRTSKIKCHICNIRFKTISNLKEHIGKHNLEKSSFCYICKASFDSSEDCDNHTLLKHSKKIKSCNSKQCPICGYMTLKTSHYNKHMESHGNTKLYQCIECDYSTNRKENLKIHQILHNNDKPYCCTHKNCYFKCVTKSGLNSHEKKHNPESNTLYCHKCSYKTIYKQSLRKHLASHVNNSIKIKGL